ncbi:NUDIX domain-containing protein [Amycolatopsis sp. cmx-4-61]|uniref:NUDIX domain-containing protein n=1 Tax=Amycolatopsis sp. cmx-4-61 TaxID=2790937 RepID=UPI00397C3B09
MPYTSFVDVLIILERGEQVLLATRANTGYADGQWNLPSGKLEEGEDLVAAIIREAREEIDVEVDRDDLEMVTSVHYLNPEGQAGSGFSSVRGDGRVNHAMPSRTSARRSHGSQKPRRRKAPCRTPTRVWSFTVVASGSGCKAGLIQPCRCCRDADSGGAPARLTERSRHTVVGPRQGFPWSPVCAIQADLSLTNRYLRRGRLRCHRRARSFPPPRRPSSLVYRASASSRFVGKPRRPVARTLAGVRVLGHNGKLPILRVAEGGSAGRLVAALSGFILRCYAAAGIANSPSVAPAVKAVHSSSV